MISPNYYSSLYSNLQLLPEPIQKQVFDYISFLVFRYYVETPENTVKEMDGSTSSLREFGVFKNKIRLSPDFNDAMDEFNEY